MNLNQLQYVITLAQELNFSRAAEKLYISQPSLSQSIQLLEEEFGVLLFERKPLKLTYAGEIFLDWAKNVLYSEEQMQNMISDVASEKRVKFTIGISPYRATFLLPRLIEKFKNKYPMAHLIIEEFPTDTLHEMLEEDRLDILIESPMADNERFESVYLCKERILLGIPNSLADKFNLDEEIDLSLLKDVPFILLTDKQYIGKLTRKLCKRAGFLPKNYIECHNIETVQAMISRGLGVSLIPEFYAKYLVSKGSMSFGKIKDLDLSRDIAVIYSKKKYMSAPVDYFIKLLSEEINSL